MSNKNLRIMAKVGKNVLTRGLSGKIGNLMVFRTNGEKTIVSAASGSPAKKSASGQLMISGSSR